MSVGSPPLLSPPGSGGADSWSLSGNSGTTPDEDFLGTVDNQPLELRVNSARALRLEPSTTSPNLIGGHSSNSVGTRVHGATVGGGGESDAPNQATASYATVGGGQGNEAGGEFATVAGGQSNQAGGERATVGGGADNKALDQYTTVGGGKENTANNDYATVAGGQSNQAGGLNATVAGGADNTALNQHATVGGGKGNTAGNNYATVAGGQNNEAGGLNATVAGGQNNTAGNDYAAIAGGQSNQAGGDYATVAGGADNKALDEHATVGGGKQNTADGQFATVAGGQGNTAAGDYSFAAGHEAEAIHDGTFVWADNSGGPFPSARENHFAVRATGGVTFETGAGAGVFLSPGSSSWSSLSDRDAKANFAPVDEHEILARLATVPIQTWNYKSQDPSIRHIGPAAQDFHTAFGVGEDDRHISTVDADGVALAAIQGLYRLVQEQDTRIAALEADNAALKAENAAQQGQIAALEARLATLEQAVGVNGDPARAERAGASPTSTTGLPAGWPLFGGLFLIGFASGQRWRTGGRR